MKKPAAAVLIMVVSLLGFPALAPAGAGSAEPDDSLRGSAAVAQLFIAEDGVALSRFPSRGDLTRTVQVRAVGNRMAVPWEAYSNAPWLAVTASGTTEGNLTLRANTAGLAKNTLYTATATVAAIGSPTDQAAVQVSLWLGSTDPVIVQLPQTVVSLATNPVAPLVYVSAGGSSVYVYNVYSGTLVATFTDVAPTVGNLVVDSSGARLFAVDTTNYRIVAVDTAGGTVLQTYDLIGPIDSDFSFAYARPEGVATLFAPNQPAIDVQTGGPVSASLGGTYTFYDGMVVATRDGSRLAIVERGLSPGSLYTYHVSSSGGQLTLTALQQQYFFLAGSNCQSLAISADGNRLYPACGAPYEFDVYAFDPLAQVQTLPAVPYPDGAVVDAKGDFVGSVNGLYQADDVFVYDPAGYLVGEVPTTNYSAAQGQGANLVAVSGDSKRVITATGAPYGPQQLIFRNLP
jgi:sugar lactone lactonase YvrE